MKLAVNLVYQGAGALARAAEELGYVLALAPEGYRSDAPSLLGYVAGQTERIGLASGVMQIPGRSPAMAALTAATLDSLSDGRFRLGLGVSNPDVSAGWYGVPFDHPLARTREYVEIVRAALRGGPVRYDARYHQLGTAGHSHAPLHLLTEPLRADLPIYLGAMRPKNLRLAGEIGDGWIGVFVSPTMVKSAVAEIAAGRELAGKGMDGFDVLPCVATAFADDPRRAADQLRNHFVYLLGIGDPGRNLFCAIARELGFGQPLVEVHDRLQAGDRAGAAVAVPFELIEETSLIGSVDRVAGRIRDYAEAGVTTLGIMVSAASASLERRLSILRDAAAALDRSGADG